MGKKSAKRRTIWKSLPLSTEEGGECCSEDDVSTTSSGRSPGLVLRMRSNGYRHRRLSDREPLVKLESKTFDEEEYTKITTPRQDVLFKKGYFARRKLESSIEESVCPAKEGEEEPMEQMIITNGFVDERGHYLVNGSSYEIYDPYTNTVTVVVGPPPYTNGITPPVLAAVSCQPVPLQAVDWYPPGNTAPGEWPPGPAWTPAYPKPDAGDADSPGGVGDDQPPLFPPQPFLFQNLLYPLPIDLTTGDPHNSVDSSQHQNDAGHSPDLDQENDEKRSDAALVTPISTPLKPTVEEFVPISHMKLPPPAFAPAATAASAPSTAPTVASASTPASADAHQAVANRPLQPATAEFFPQSLAKVPSPAPVTSSSTLRPTGAVFVPRQQLQQQTHQKPPTQETTISLPRTDAPTRGAEPSASGKDQSPLPPLPQRPARRQTEVPAKICPAEPPITVPPKATETEKALETASNEAQRSSAPASKQPGSESTTPSKELARVTTGEDLDKAEPLKESQGTQTPKEERRSPQLSPRRSYAKTVSNGLDQKPLNDPIPCAQPPARDNKEVDVKRVVQNGTILINGHDEKSANAKEFIRNGRNTKEMKRVNINGQDRPSRDVENGWHNGASPHRIPKDRLNNGNEKGAKKDAKEVFYNKKPEINNGLYNGKNKEVIQNGQYNGKDRQVNGKTPNRNKAPYERKPQLDYAKNDAMIAIQQVDTDMSSDTFRPVENRRNRAQVNGHLKRPNQLPKADVNEKEILEQTVMDDLTIETRPQLQRLDTATSICASEKSSTISELSSPTDLSSGQTTPPDAVIDGEIQENHSKSLSKSVEKLSESLNEKKPKKSAKKSKKNGSSRRIEAKEEVKAEEDVEEFSDTLPDFLQPPKDEIFDLDLSATFDHALLRSLRQNEPAISKVNLFPPRTPSFPCDLYTKTNLSQMRATKPEEFFASIVDTPSLQADLIRQSEKPRKAEKIVKAPMDIRTGIRKQMSTAYKPSRKVVKEEEQILEKEEPKEEKQETKLGIVDAVKTWLETQEGVLTTADETPVSDPKNVESNPSRASSVEGDAGCLRVAAKSPSPDLATLTDARTSVDKYYNLSGRRASKTSETSEVSEQEAVDALEYAFPRPPTLAPHTSQFPTKDLACKLQ